ncbi:flavin reductase family protein [Streptomyces sp. NBC_01429]|uniref:flavin reductase family protein n=1 Tax=Streptomyces sp. NBC_01429 TaxID=2903862 RepID=UPI002E2D563C|nr:flavin reductase family protein [Streptomyces sp. NBC_01429]
MNAGTAAGATTGPVTTAALRAVARCLPTGVTVVTGGRGEEVHGMTVNSFGTLSLAPPLVSFSVGAGARIRALIERYGGFVVNVLAAEQDALARKFADPDRPVGPAGFAGMETGRPSPHGGLRLPGSLAHFTCDSARFIAVGDHVIVVGSVRECATLRQAPPLVFEGGTFRTTGEPGRTEGVG